MPDIDQKTLLQLSLAAKRHLKFDTPLDPDSDQLVELNVARGSFQESKLLWSLGIEGDNLEVNSEPLYMLFGGHRGCGKSTELKRLAKKLHAPNRYYVVFVDALAELDINNLYYSDVLLAQAKVLFSSLEKSGLRLEPVFLTRLEEWFYARVEKHETLQSFSADITAGVEVKSGLPFLGALFAKMSVAARDKTSHHEELRKAIRNSFSEFSSAFNALLAHVVERLRENYLGQDLLFVVDGTDRLRGEDADRFFVADVHQLQQIHSHFIYCAPIDILSESGALRQHFAIERLPMIKLMEKGCDAVKPEALKALRELITRRMDKRLFDKSETLDYLIWHSGGHLRDLVRLMHLALRETLGKQRINRQVADAVIAELSSEYRRLIHQEDYALLVEIDQAQSDYTPTSEKTRQLLYDLALLEYNRYWWQSHPVVRKLAAYEHALKAAQVNNG